MRSRDHALDRVDGRGVLGLLPCDSPAVAAVQSPRSSVPGATALHLEHVWPYSAVVGILVESVVAMILLAQLPLDKKPNGDASEAQEALVLFFVTYVLNMLIEGGTIALRRRHCPGLCAYSHTDKGGLGLGLANSDFGKLPSEGGDEL